MENVELEYRSEISINDFDTKAQYFSKNSTLHSHTKRLTVMGVLEQGDIQINSRVRITRDGINGNVTPEFVIKKGAGHAYNRIEISQIISLDEFVGFARIISEIVPTEKTMFTRETYNYRTESGIDIALVKAQKHAYIEFEKITTVESEDDTKAEILEFIHQNGFHELDKDASVNLFKRLDQDDDKVFNEFLEVESLLNKYLLSFNNH